MDKMMEKSDSMPGNCTMDKENCRAAANERDNHMKGSADQACKQVGGAGAGAMHKGTKMC